jgi:hypothetical protein
MALETLQTDKTTDGVTSGVAIVGSFTIIIPKDSVFNGAWIEVEVATSDTADDYGPPDDEARFIGPGSKVFDMTGTNYVRIKQSYSAYDTSITVQANN